MVQAHTVPNLTVEADFALDGSAKIQVNLDPRLFLADDPTTLPPIPADWIRNMGAEERAKIDQQASAYLEQALAWRFGEDAAPMVMTWSFLAIDGGTGGELSDETVEVHLLAQTQIEVPAAEGKFCVAVLEGAKAAMVLLNRLGEQAERRAQVLFPGETSRPFQCRPEEKASTSAAGS